MVVEKPKFVQKYVKFMDLLGGEERGIEWALTHEKTDQKRVDNFSVCYDLATTNRLMFGISTNLSVSTFSVGKPGPLIQLMD